MRVHLIKRQTIEIFAVHHSDSYLFFEEWLNKLKLADWSIPSDFKKMFPSADLLGKGTQRVVFDIGGNKYRMICKYHFGINRVRIYVRWLGTHAEYNKLCRKEEQFII